MLFIIFFLVINTKIKMPKILLKSTVFTRIQERTVIKAFLLFELFPNEKSDLNIRKKLLLFETKEKKLKLQVYYQL